MAEVDDMSLYGRDLELAPFEAELDALWQEHGSRINCLITEPYLGGGGSYHPPSAYLQLLQNFCHQHDVLFILDEVQSNFGRTGSMYAFQQHGLEPDFVVLGKGLGNGVPVSAAVGRGDVMASLTYGEASDTWSANPMSCAAVLATLDEFEHTDVLQKAATLSQVMADGLNRLKHTALIAKVRGEGMVFGIECPALGDLSANEVANAVVEACYRGEPGGDGIHLLGPLAGKVIRVSPPMTMTLEQAEESLKLFYDILQRLADKLFATAT
jgi:4-aminobutyrate aminotransferase-like enzyme